MHQVAILEDLAEGCQHVQGDAGKLGEDKTGPGGSGKGRNEVLKKEKDCHYYSETMEKNG